MTNRHGDLCDVASPLLDSGAAMDSALIVTVPNGSARNLEQVMYFVFT